MFRFDLELVLQGQLREIMAGNLLRTAKIKSALTHLLLVLEVCNVKPTFRKSSYGLGNLLIRFDLGPLQGQTRIAKLKSAYNSLIFGLGGLQCETNLQGIIGWESSDVVRFDLEPLPQGQTRTAEPKNAYNMLIIDPTGLQCETNW